MKKWIPTQTQTLLMESESDVQHLSVFDTTLTYVITFN